jgi:hypothetical protein
MGANPSRSMRLPVVCALIAACGDKGDSGGAGDDDAQAATFTRVYDEVLLPSCAYSSCHLGAGNAQLGWDDAATAYTSLVNVASTQVETMDRVTPGAPDDSYLMWKFEDAAGITGDQMPPSVPLTSAQTALVRGWITAGAAND